MKTQFTLIMVIAVSLSVFAQSPQKMSYQCVVRNTSGALVKNQSVGVRIAILQGSATGAVVYHETHNPNPQTNENGLLSIQVGSGLIISGTFSNINWSAGPYFLMTEIDPTGATTYTITATSELLSVPYAFHATSVGSYNETDPVFDGSPAKGISGGNITNWNTAYGWGNHAGLYRSVTWVPEWTDITGKPSQFPPIAHNHSAAEISSGVKGLYISVTKLTIFSLGISI